MLSEAFILILTKRLGFTERIRGDCDILTVSSLICLLSCSTWLSCFAVIILICSRCSWFSCWYLIASSSRSALRFSANCQQHSSQYITVSDDTMNNATHRTRSFHSHNTIEKKQHFGQHGPKYNAIYIITLQIADTPATTRKWYV